MAEKIRLAYRVLQNIESKKYQYLIITLLAIVLIYLNLSLKIDFFLLFATWYLIGEDKERELAYISLISLVVALTVAVLDRDGVAEYLLLLSYEALALAIAKKAIDLLSHKIFRRNKSGSNMISN